MKKAISILLVILLLSLSISVYAEPFSLRNGIFFGDTMEEVKSKEQLKYINGKEDKNWFRGTIANVDDSEVSFYFDKETGQLTDMSYYLGARSTVYRSNYDEIKESLIKKYGNPLGNTGGYFHVIVGKAVESYIRGKTIANMYNSKDDLLDYDEWLINCDGGAVKIDLILESTSHLTISLSYHFATDEEIEKLMEEEKDKQDSLENDI